MRGPAIIIGVGLGEDALGAEAQQLELKSSVGRHEVARLMGTARASGRGPLPAFVNAALEEQAVGAPVHFVLLQDTTADVAEGGAAPPVPVDLAPPLQGLEGRAETVLVDEGTLPWKALQACIESVTSGTEEEPRLLIVGTHTERRLLETATLLRTMLGYARVAACAHLSGSSTREAHFATFQHNLPVLGVEVFLDLDDAAQYVGLASGPLRELACRPCELEPEGVRKELDPTATRIIQLLCMHWTRARLRPLTGGFSGSLLFLADGWKGEARTEPMVLKIDSFPQMRREIGGYHQVKDFFGKHVPTFGYPVALGESIGVGMELAAMEGRPETLQDAFVAADDEESFGRFMRRLEKSLDLVASKLYGNTRMGATIVPYREFDLHTDRQVGYLHFNAEYLHKYHAEDLGRDLPVDTDALETLLKVISANEDGIESEVCLAHGDLNYQNVICDSGDNVWFIDWTHTNQYPIELDFAKLESDVKFVLSKEFDLSDLPRLKEFEEFILSHRIPPDANHLPESLKFARWDLRYRKILAAVRRIREVCFSLKASEDWLVYRIALLRYALHTTSFDRRRGRGECEFQQLMHALFSVENLMFDLMADDYHLKIRAERPPSYPPRLRLSIDQAPWSVGCDDYSPPYHVDSRVLASDRSRTEGGWADPEDFALVREELDPGEGRRDDEGRPLNPRGRTGLAGRGLLGRWGPNLSVGAVVTRRNEDTGELDILLGRKEGERQLSLPMGFVRPGETAEHAVARMLEEEAGWAPSLTGARVTVDGYAYDPRQTDHAWVVVRLWAVHLAEDQAPSLLRPGGQLEEVGWLPLVPETINDVVPQHARFIREAVEEFGRSKVIPSEQVEGLLVATG